MSITRAAPPTPEVHTQAAGHPPPSGCTPGGGPTTLPSVIGAVIFDIDGVLRRWDPAVFTAAEGEHQLPSGSLRRAAFAEPYLTGAVTGALTDVQWRAGVGTRLAAAAVGVTQDRAAAAVRQWSRSVGTLDPDVAALLDAQRRLRRVALLSNATDRLEADLAALGVTGRVDAVFNTSRLGVAKPDPAVFTMVCALLRFPPEQCALLDDTPGHVLAARAAGLRGHLFTTAAAARQFLAALDPPPPHRPTDRVTAETGTPDAASPRPSATRSED